MTNNLRRREYILTIDNFSYHCNLAQSLVLHVSDIYVGPMLHGDIVGKYGLQFFFEWHIYKKFLLI